MAQSGTTAEALAMLETASRAGNANASIEGALWLLRGFPVPRDIAKAREFTERGAAQGHADALLLNIAMKANGSGGPADWSAALVLLRQYAPRHDWLQRELALVDKLDLRLDGYPNDCPSGELLNADLGLAHFAGFLSQEEAQHIANVAVQTLKPSTVFDPASGRQVANPIRTSDGTVIGPAEEDLVVQAINRRIASATGTTFEQGEPISVLRYNPGQEYRLHFDAINNEVNNRIKTVIVYLNDAFEGGETHFPALGLTIKPSAGDAIVFDNLRSDGSIIRESRHAGLPVRRGVKWVATRWIRRQLYDPWSAKG